MIPSHWLGYRRNDDGELLGYLVPTEGALFTPVTVFGYSLGPAGAREQAERRLDEVGLGYLADRWQLHVADHPEAISVEIVEANPKTLTVKNVDYESNLGYGHRFTLEVRSRVGCVTPEAARMGMVIRSLAGFNGSRSGPISPTSAHRADQELQPSTAMTTTGPGGGSDW